MSPADIDQIDASEFLTVIDDLLAVYSAAMAPPPEQLPGRAAIMERHAGHPGFRAMVARRGPDVIGFAYGFRGAPGQWWHDVVATALAAAHGHDHARGWLEDCFEIGEVHVLPDHQSRGVGRALVTRLCAGRRERTAVLSTHDAASPARHLYSSLGFVDLITGYRFPGSGEPYAVMGARLPLRHTSASAGPSTGTAGGD